MSNGLNEKFITNPWSFLVDNVLFLFAGVSTPVEGIYDFDLFRLKTGVISAVRFDDSKTAADSPRIRAYWLPWSSEKTVTAQLTATTAAEYFFTSDLGGCRVMISPAPGGGVCVAHIAGDGKSATGADPTGSQWRSAQAMAQANSLALQTGGTTGSEVMGRSRSLSSTVPMLLSTPGAHGYKLVDESGATVVGKKMSNNTWEFWYQIYNYRDDKASLTKIDQLWP
jgi:hypothetical protein